MKKNFKVFLVLYIFILYMFFLINLKNSYAEPTGANLIPGYSSRKPLPNATNLTAQNGNITWVTADLTQITSIWQGFFGRVTGGIVLENSNGDVFYDWNVVDAVGEIIATRNFVSDWTKVNCTNQTEIYLEEERLNILNETSDGINDTFIYTSHPSFDIAGKFLSNCRATRTHNSTNAQAVFWNVLLNTNSTNTIYTVLMENDKIGFNNTQVDFQLLVPVDKLTGFATYFVYVELG
ncbi:MAG: hypothetical protein QXM96_01305 [Candidatus Woesearchaeota archaeon]